MKLFLAVSGTLLLLFGLFLAGGNLFNGLLGVSGGLVVIGLAKLIEVAEQISRKLDSATLTPVQLKRGIARAVRLPLTSEHIELRPSLSGRYKVVTLERHDYMDASCFESCCAVEGNVWTFRMPGHSPIALHKSDRYYTGIDLFEFEDVVYVRLEAIKLKVLQTVDKAVLSLRP